MPGTGYLLCCFQFCLSSLWKLLHCIYKRQDSEYSSISVLLILMWCPIARTHINITKEEIVGLGYRVQISLRTCAVQSWRRLRNTSNQARHTTDVARSIICEICEHQINNLLYIPRVKMYPERLIPKNSDIPLEPIPFHYNNTKQSIPLVPFSSLQSQVGF